MARKRLAVKKTIPIGEEEAKRFDVKPKRKNNEKIQCENKKAILIRKEQNRNEKQKRFRPASERLAVKHEDGSDLQGRDSPGNT